MIKILTYHEIDQQQWNELVQSSPTATWFQTKEAYEFYAAVSGMHAFACGVAEEDRLVGVVVGYTTQETCKIKQHFTCRTIIYGGPLLADDISDEALYALLSAVAQLKDESLKFKGKENSKAEIPASTPYTIHYTPIYMEIRNFHDYSRWRAVFTHSGFEYKKHLNFHVNTSTIDLIDQNISDSRKRDIRTTIRQGVKAVYNPSLEQVRTYYQILKHLYKTKVKTPLFDWEFFETLYQLEHAHYILVEHQGRIIGGTIVMELPNKAMYEWFECGLDGVGEHIFPSTYATYLGLKYAAEHACPLFDMMGAGQPDIPYGVRDFKAKFGGELVEHGRFLCIRKPLLYWIGKMGVKFLKRKRK